MKRHPALRDLSSDHHLGLVQARRLVNAAGSDAVGSQSTGVTGATGDAGAEALAADEVTEAAKVAHDFLAFWAEHTVRHFREEEEVLLPAFARYGDPSLEPVVRVLVEHVHIRRLVDDLGSQVEAGRPSMQTMRAIGELLRAHIRHEEDVLFPLIEEAMPEEALRVLPGQFLAFSEQR